MVMAGGGYGVGTVETQTFQRHAVRTQDFDSDLAGPRPHCCRAALTFRESLLPVKLKARVTISLCSVLAPSRDTEPSAGVTARPQAATALSPSANSVSGERQFVPV